MIFPVNPGNHVKIDPKLRERDWAYLAGMFDLMGSLLFVASNDRRKIVLRISAAEQPLSGWLMHFCGGSTDSRRWNLSRRADVQHFLSMVIPYLKVKSGIAERALSWLEDPTDENWERLQSTP